MQSVVPICSLRDLRDLMRQVMVRLLFGICFLLSTLSLQASHSAIVKEEFIFEKPPFASCHASTLAETPSGELLCAFFAGTHEGASDVAIWQSRFAEEKWSAPCKIAQAEQVPCWNPVLFTMSSDKTLSQEDPSDEILLFYKVGPNPREWSGALKRSFNNGISWSQGESLPAGILGPVRSKPLQLNDGTLLCGSSLESWKRWGCWIDITSDGGRSWMKSTPINVPQHLYGIIQPTLFLTKAGGVKLLARSHGIGFICSAGSSDGGLTWSDAKATELPNPNSGIDAVRLKNGFILLVYNHSQKNRFPLNVALSKDDATTWSMKIALEEDPGEYSYPAAIQTRDGLVHITYTWNRTHIKHVVIDPHQLY